MNLNLKKKIRINSPAVAREWLVGRRELTPLAYYFLKLCMRYREELQDNTHFFNLSQILNEITDEILSPSPLTSQKKKKIESHNPIPCRSHSGEALIGGVLFVRDFGEEFKKASRNRRTILHKGIFLNLNACLTRI